VVAAFLGFSRGRERRRGALIAVAVGALPLIVAAVAWLLVLGPGAAV